MSNYIANCPVSMPINTPGIRPDANFNGLMFSYDIGPFYITQIDEAALQPPQGD